MRDGFFGFILSMLESFFDYHTAEFEFFIYGPYRVEYLMDMGAGYMTGCPEPEMKCSIKHVMQGYRQNDVEKVYFKDKLVYKANWASSTEGEQLYRMENL